MKILFICGSVEPGKDGVGDYARSLAAALIRIGQQAAVMALSDRAATAICRQMQAEGETAVPTFRVPAAINQAERWQHAQVFLNEFGPEWVSIQYVPFSFNARGLPFGFAKKLQGLVNKSKVHIMFHELWVGIKDHSPRSHYIYRFFQKRIARSLVSKLRPRLVHTSNKVYQLALQDAGINNEILPLFSNIPFGKKDLAFTTQLLALSKINADERSAYEIHCVFGSIFPGIRLDTVIPRQIEQAQLNGKKMVLVFMGRTDKAEVERLEKLFGEQITVVSFGELPTQHISTVLQNADKAISTTPKEFIGKSGVYALFKRHQLPVLCPFSISVSKYKAEMEKYFSYLETREPEEWDVSNTAKKLYDNFSMYTNI